VFGYDDENQLTNVMVANAWKSEFFYDGKMRRRLRREFTWQNGAWVQTNEVRYVYDGNLVVQERDNFNVVRVTYTRGSDLSGNFEGAGGIGGLLARSDHSTLSPQHAYYYADGNGNVTTLTDTNQTAVARYAYEPFGNVFSISGPLATANLYRFSSKEAHEMSGSVYYLYRYYDPTVQRWMNRDPIAELGGDNLYGFVQNDPIRNLDSLGLCSSAPPCCLIGYTVVGMAISGWFGRDCSYSMKVDYIQPYGPKPCCPKGPLPGYANPLTVGSFITVESSSRCNLYIGEDISKRLDKASDDPLVIR
jgi:RHS repeat-associated protein